MWRLRSTRTLVITAAVAAFVLFCVSPLVYMLARSGGSAATYAVLLLDVRQRVLLYNTATLGAGTALLATMIGAPLGLALARFAVPFKFVFRIGLAAPLLLPPYVIGLAWVYLGGSAGVLATVTGHDVLSSWTYSLPGAIAVLSLSFYPILMFATEVAVRRVEPRLEEAALLVAPPWRVLQHITLPLVARSIAAAALVVFVLAISEFGIPGLLRVRVFTTEVFTAFAAQYDFGRATVVALPLLGLSLVVAAVALLLVSERRVISPRGQTNAQAIVFGWKYPASVFAGSVLAIALVIPLAVLIREALAAPTVAVIVQGSRDAIRNSLVLGALGATGVTLIAVWLGYARARARHPLRFVADVLFVVLFAVPSTIVGVGLIGIWNRPGLFGSVYGTDGMLLLVYLARFLPAAALGIAAGLRSVPASHEEAAAVAGAGWSRTMVHIVLPQTRLALLATWLVVFILAFGELGASILVAPPGEATLPIRIYTMIANAPSSHVAALALLQSGVVLAPLIVLAVGVNAGRPR